MTPLMLRNGVESELVAAAHPLEHSVAYCLLLLVDALPDDRLGVLQLLLVVLEDARYILLRLGLEPLELLVQRQCLLLQLELGVRINSLHRPLLTVINQPQRGRTGEHLR